MELDIRIDKGRQRSLFQLTKVCSQLCGPVSTLRQSKSSQLCGPVSTLRQSKSSQLCGPVSTLRQSKSSVMWASFYS